MAEEIEVKSEIIEMPAIMRAGQIVMCSPELNKLSQTQLSSVTSVMTGELVYLKVRATYTMPEQTFCYQKDCYALVDVGNYCERHHKK